MSEYLYIEFAKGTLVLHLIFSGISHKILSEVEFYRENKDQRQKILGGCVDVGKFMIHNTRSKHWLLFHNVQNVSYLYQLRDVFASGIFWGHSVYSRSVDLKLWHELKSPKTTC